MSPRRLLDAIARRLARRRRPTIGCLSNQEIDRL
jgi:hypothetical protein